MLKSARPLALATLLLSSTALHAHALEFNARSAYVVHPESGTVLANFNGDQRLGPASLTKMMTLYLIFQNLKTGKITLDTQVPISETAWRTGGSKMFVKVGDRVRVEDLIRGIAIVSGNDATVAMAEYLGGTIDGFAGMMNAEAKKIGMNDSHFTNPHGIPAVEGQVDPNLYTTAHDMAKLLTALFRDFPEYRKYMAEEEFTYNGIKQQNRNGLLHLGVGIDACKTGHTAESGYHLASTAVQNGERLVVVVMGTDGFSGRENESLKAYRTFYAQNSSVSLARAGDDVVAQVPVWHGDVGTANLTVAQPFKAFINRNEAEKIKLQASYKKPLLAPLDPSQPVGELVATLPSGQVLSTSLVVEHAIPEAGFGTKWVQSLFNRLGLANK